MTSDAPRLSSLRLSNSSNGNFGRKNGVLFIGYAEGALGIGQAFRFDLEAAANTALPFAVYPFRAGIESRLIGPFMPERYDTEHAYDVNIIEVAATEAPTVFRSLDRRIFANSYNILRTYWELSKAPQAWRPLLERVDEIWAPDPFIAESFRDIFEGPITVIPPAVHMADEDYPDRGAYGMEAERFYFLFNFDYFSIVHRKNPAGVVKAFRLAFPSGKEKVGLVMKSTGKSFQDPAIPWQIRAAMAGDRRIRGIDETLTRNQMLGLLRAADAYVSLHRAEGFGLGMVEAMNFGRPVIATDYSGNTDFLNQETGFPVPYTLRPVRAHEYTWTEGQVWAEPDVAAAARLMRQVVDEPEVARKRADAGRRFVKEKFGLPAVGQAMRARLEELGQLPNGG